MKAWDKKLNEEPSTRLDGFSKQTLTDFNKALREKADGIISDINADKVRHWVKEHQAELKGRSMTFRGILQSARVFEEHIIKELLPAEDKDASETAEDRRDIRSAYDDFSAYDAQLFPIEFVADRHEKDVIETHPQHRSTPSEVQQQGFWTRSRRALYHLRASSSARVRATTSSGAGSTASASSSRRCSRRRRSSA